MCVTLVQACMALGSSSMGPQCQGRLGTRFYCGAGALHVSHACVARAWHFAIAASGCRAEGIKTLASCARLPRLMWVTLVLNVHDTRRGDGSIGLQG